MVNTRELIEHLKQFVFEERFERLREVLDNRTKYITVVLEDIFQSHNASAVLRSCECLGVQDIHLIENKYSFEAHPDIVLGSAKWLSINKYNLNTNNTRDCLLSLKKKGYTIVATSPHAKGYTPENLPLDNPIALVFGTELEGLSEEALSQSDKFLQIPMVGFTESFNISVSAAICLYDLCKRVRNSEEIQWRLSDYEKDGLMFEWLKKSIKSPDLIIERFRNSKES